MKKTALDLYVIISKLILNSQHRKWILPTIFSCLSR